MNIEHVVVLMMENRSFDHLFGYLDHPDPDFPALTGSESNIDEYGDEISVNDMADYTLVPGPKHHHKDIMEQLFGDADPSVSVPNNSGFAKNYGRPPEDEDKPKGEGANIMGCLKPNKIPIMATLAKQYCLCTNWFSSVPGATWPNRLFVHAATSDKKADNKHKLYTDRTIFEHLNDAGKKTVIFRDGIAQSLAYRKLWDVPLIKKRNQFQSMKRFYKKAEAGSLPHYSFIEPNHMGSNCNSLHPGYIEHDASAFTAGERLISSIYKALTGNRAAWEKTLFVITFDEHGGFYDRKPPPKTTPPEPPDPDDIFDFDRLGVRVPALLISPWVEEAALDDTQYDHSSIIKTLQVLFTPGAAPLTDRDRDANHILSKLTRATPRLDPVYLPDIPFDLMPRARADEPAELDEFQLSLIELNKMVEAVENDTGPELLPTAKGDEAAEDSLKTLGDVDDYQRAAMARFRGED